MAAFSQQNSLLNPILPNPETLREILEILRLDPNSILLETKITDLGFSLNVVEKLRNDPQFLLHSIETLYKKLKELQKEHLKITTEAYIDWVEKGIVNDDLNLFEKMLVSQQHEVIRKLESKWYLPRTGDFDSMVNNYRRDYYTRQCFHFHQSLDFCVRGAARWGHVDIVKEALEKGANDYNSAMSSAAWNRHKEIVQMMLAEGADNYNETMFSAAGNGRKEIVEMMLDLGAYSYKETMISAVSHGHIEIVKMMLDKSVYNYNELMYQAAINGRKEIVEMMLELGADDYNGAMYSAVQGGHKEIVQMILDREAK